MQRNSAGTGASRGLHLNDGNPLFTDGGDVILKWRHETISTVDFLLGRDCWGLCDCGEIRVPGLPAGSVALGEGARSQWLRDHSGAWKVSVIKNGELFIPDAIVTMTGNLRKLMDLEPMSEAVVTAEHSSPAQGSITFSGTVHTRQGGYRVATVLVFDPYCTANGQIVSLDSVGAFRLVRSNPGTLELLATNGSHYLLTHTTPMAIPSAVQVAVPAAEQMKRDDAPPPPQPPDDVEGKLLTLKRLLDQGLLTEQEFAAKKAELLASF